MSSTGIRTYTSNAVNCTFTEVAARLGPLAPGTYSVVAEVDAYFLQCDSAGVATASGNPCFAKSAFELTVQGAADAWISFIRQTSTGNAKAWASRIR